jgi:demethylmenaquinone methyltransferase/2-methoxy-6-polyprenyl-1,4-benzoquinol methylase
VPSARRYGTATALAYDAISGERPVYRAGRVAAVEALRLAPGDAVLDLGCGTGLDLPLLLPRIGPAGSVVALDASAAMLAATGRRAARAGAARVHLVRADATTVDAAALRPGGRPADAVLACYTLSLMADWPAAWRTAVAAARPGARMAVVDLAATTGRARPVAPLARLACWMGGSDPAAHPWTALERECTDVTALSLRGGHVQVRMGTLR